MCRDVVETWLLETETETETKNLFTKMSVISKWKYKVFKKYCDWLWVTRNANNTVKTEKRQNCSVHAESSLKRWYHNQIFRVVYPPNSHGAIPPILTSTPLLMPTLAHNFWTLSMQFCAIWCVFSVNFGSCQSGIMTKRPKI